MISPQRIKVGDRVRHCDGREGKVEAFLGSGEAWVALFDGGYTAGLPGFWERLKPESLNPTRRAQCL